MALYPQLVVLQRLCDPDVCNDDLFHVVLQIRICMDWLAGVESDHAVGIDSTIESGGFLSVIHSTEIARKSTGNIEGVYGIDTAMVIYVVYGPAREPLRRAVESGPKDGIHYDQVAAVCI